MINLIPNQEKKKMAKSFYYRLAVLSMVMLSISVVVAILALLPAYFFSNSKNNIASKKLEMQQTDAMPLVDQQTSSIMKDISNKITLVENAEKNKYNISEKVINTIFLKKVSGIKISEISYDNTTNNGKKIGINGTASSREVLLLFRRALEEDPSFKSVNLPISNFVKGSDIQFYLSLIPA